MKRCKIIPFHVIIILLNLFWLTNISNYETMEDNTCFLQQALGLHHHGPSPSSKTNDTHSPSRDIHHHRKRDTHVHQGNHVDHDHHPADQHQDHDSVHIEKEHHVEPYIWYCMVLLLGQSIFSFAIYLWIYWYLDLEFLPNYFSAFSIISFIPWRLATGIRKRFLQMYFASLEMNMDLGTYKLYKLNLSWNCLYIPYITWSCHSFEIVFNNGICFYWNG